MNETVAKIEETTPVQSGESAALISMIERAARDPQVDIDKMERLFQMHERIEERQRIAAFNAAMAAAQEEIRPVVRNQNNTQTHSKYADLAAISDAIDPIIRKHGLAVVASEFASSLKDHLGVRCNVKHSAGHGESYDFNIPWDGAGLKGNANKTATHAYGSTLSYGRRYAKLCVFDVATKDDDGNAASKTKQAKEPVTLDEIFKLIDDTGTKRTDILAHYSVEEFDDLSGQQRDEIKSKLTAKLAQMRRANANR